MSLPRFFVSERSAAWALRGLTWRSTRSSGVVIQFEC
jgi:hypothetical protein